MSKWITVDTELECSVNLDQLMCIEYDPKNLTIHYHSPLSGGAPGVTWNESFPSKKEYERKRSVIQRKQNAKVE